MCNKKQKQEDLDELFAIFDKKYTEFKQKFNDVEQNINMVSQKNEEDLHEDQEI